MANQCDNPNTMQEPVVDPFLWLEEITSERSIGWVKEQNARSTAILQQNPIFSTIHNELKAIYLSDDRIPWSSFSYGYFWNFWQDAKNKQGVWRRTTYEEYQKAEPKWQVLLDLDELSEKEHIKWVYKGRQRLDRNSSLCLLHLSQGGSDAIVLREFNIDTQQFITGADSFCVTNAAKTSITPLNEEELLIGTNFDCADADESSLTDSGYPRIIKLWRRSQPLSAATIRFTVEKSDVTASARLLRDGEIKRLVFVRSINRYASEFYLEQMDKSLRKLPIPQTASLLAIKQNWIYLHLKHALTLNSGVGFPTDSVIRFSIDASDLEQAEFIFAIRPYQSLESVSVRNDGCVFVEILDMIKSKVLKLQSAPNKTVWIVETLPFPKTGIIHLHLKDEEDPTDFTTLSYRDHLKPTTQYQVYAPEWSLQKVLKTGPKRFDDEAYEVVQQFATSRDSTQIPYFVLKRKDLVLDGTHPTLLYGYGGFEKSLTPSYQAAKGKVWLERGGVYAIANIRGGGELGSSWHQAALKEKRQTAFDDFIAVAEHLISQKYTLPSRLGIEGASNGGLLVAAVLMQRPDLFNAAIINCPLLDMLRFHKLHAGSSWCGEFGSVEIPKEYESLKRYSPYHNVRADGQYCRPLLTASTKDDRVHPAHSRKFVAKMLSLGHSVLYYENIDGGHAGSSNLDERAYKDALEFSYLFLQLASTKLAQPRST